MKKKYCIIKKGFGKYIYYKIEEAKGVEKEDKLYSSKKKAWNKIKKELNFCSKKKK